MTADYTMALVASVANSAANAAAQRIGAALSDAQYFESNMVALEQIRRQLDSSSTKDKLDAMKRVIALISLGKDASTFFPEVVKNVAASSLEVKKLVYLYLVHYAEFKQDLALLAINSFQKDLSDPNQHIRALSLRVLSSIRVKIILQVVVHAIGKSANDSSAYVRKAAAYAICKVCELDSSCKQTLLEPLRNLIADRSTQVIGAAVVAFEEVTPDAFHIIHPHYRRICRVLNEIDPWGQIAVMQMLLRYARANFADPYKGVVVSNNSAKTAESEADFYADVPKGAAGVRNKDLSLLLTNVLPLFYSLNNSVVMSAIAIYYHLGSPEEFCTHAIKPLMRLVGIDDDGSQIVGLRLAVAVAVRHPSSLLPYISEFYVSARHSAPVKELRMHVLNTMCQMAGDARGLGSRPQARKELLFELQDYLFRSDRGLAAAAARAIGSLATAHPESTLIIVKLLSSVVSTAKDPIVVTESISVLRGLLQRHPETQTKALPQLIAMLLNTDSANAKIGTVTEPAARASIVWLIGEFYNHVQGVAMEALRLLAKGFAKEAAVVKLQVLNLSAKLLACNISNNLIGTEVSTDDNNVESVRRKLLEYLCKSARFDSSYDVRDKARVLQCLFLSASANSLRSKACHALLSKKPVKKTGEDGVSDDSVMNKGLPSGVVLGSMSHVLGVRRLPGTLRLRPWSQSGTEDALRDESDAVGSSVLEREYAGISSASFGHMPSQPTSISSTISNTISSRISNSLWPPSNQMPSDSFQRDAIGRVIGFGQPSRNVDASHLFNRPSHQGIDVTKIDPESFYASSDSEEDSSEYETDSEDEEEDEEEETKDRENEKQGNTEVPAVAPKVVETKSLTGLEDILAGIPTLSTNSTPIPATVFPTLMQEAKPIKHTSSVEASLMHNLINLNLEDDVTQDTTAQPSSAAASVVETNKPRSNEPEKTN